MPPAGKKKEKVVAQEVIEPEQGEGVYIFPNGDKYEGDYQLRSDGGLERFGKGTHTSRDGTVYKGSWANDKMNGQGVIQFPSGSWYEGKFVENKFHGKGRYTWPDASFYEGNFIDNRMDGEAMFTDADQQVWTGNFLKSGAPGLRFKLDM